MLAVIGCMLLQPSECVEFEDLRGPYQTVQQCHVRADEMGKTIFEIMPNIIPLRYNCTKMKEGTIT